MHTALSSLSAVPISNVNIDDGKSDQHVSDKYHPLQIMQMIDHV